MWLFYRLLARPATRSWVGDALAHNSADGIRADRVCPAGDRSPVVRGPGGTVVRVRPDRGPAAGPCRSDMRHRHAARRNHRPQSAAALGVVLLAADERP